MKIDKQNGDVAFENESHTYWNVKNDKRYISVTTLIDRYVNPFDKDFWSFYKSMEKFVPSDNWIMEKRNLLSTRKINKELFDVYDIPVDEFNKVQQDILDKWAKKNKEACEYGTKVHAELENAVCKKEKDITMEKYGVGGKFVYNKESKLDLVYGVYPEYLIYRESDDGVLRLAGQIDLLIKSKNDIVLIDHKTVETMDLKSAYDTVRADNIRMKYPLNNLMDSNYWHYTMQLSTYAWMVQKMNPQFTIKDLILNHIDRDGNSTLYHCDYLKKEVTKMLAHYKKQLILDEDKRRRKKIEY